MIETVLDSSAILALLHGESGGERVHSLLPTAALCAVNYSEVVAHLVHLSTPRHVVETAMDSLGCAVIDADTDLAWEAGLLRTATRSAGLSLGDRFCLALAKRLDVPAVTADKAWATVAQAVGVEITLIR